MPKHHFTVELDGEKHEIDFEVNSWSAGKTLTIDEKEYSAEKGNYITAIGDTSFRIGEHECFIAMRSRRARLVVDGKYVDNGKDFSPLLSYKDMPK